MMMGRRTFAFGAFAFDSVNRLISKGPGKWRPVHGPRALVKSVSPLTLTDPKMTLENGAVDMRPFKEALKRKLPADSPVLTDLLNEPDSMPVGRAEVLVPHFLQRLERELERYETRGRFVLRA